MYFVDIELLEKLSVEDIVLVCKLGVLISFCLRWEEVLKRLEIVYMELVKCVFVDVVKYYKWLKVFYFIKDLVKVVWMFILVEKLGWFIELKFLYGDKIVWDVSLFFIFF